MRISRIVLAVCTLLLLAIGPQAFADVINFDGPADGTVINTFYTGVTFSCFSSGGHCNGANSGDVYARNDIFAPSSPNVVSTLQTGIPTVQDNITGAIKVSFATGQASVSIDSILVQASEAFGSTGFGYLQAYDSGLNLLTEIDNTYGGNSANLGVTKTLAYNSSSANISFLLLGDVQGANISTLFDNLCFSTTSGGCPATTGGGGNDGGGGVTAPEPASLMMLTPGLLSVPLLRRRKTRK